MNVVSFLFLRPTGSTPVVYPGRDGTSRNFIVPGLFTVEQAVQTLQQLHAVTHPDGRANMTLKRKRGTGVVEE